LSVCIPTYNFGQFIGAALDSIGPQIVPGVEVVVLDSASTDDTPEVVRQRQQTYPGIRYHRASAKGGIDRDMAAVVALAEGRYCWLFSSDDVMRPGAIAHVLRWLESGRDLYLCRHSACTVDMHYLNDHPVMRADDGLEANLSDPRAQLDYFERAETTEAFFSFMGSLIVKKATWDAVPVNEAFMGSCWGHVARLFELMPRGLTVVYRPDVLLDRRGDNDSFSDKGIVNRYGIAIGGYHRIASTFFDQHSPLALHVRRTIRNEYGLRQFMYAKMHCRLRPGSEDAAALNDLIAQTYIDAPLRGRLLRWAVALVPSSWFVGARRLSASARGIRRSLRTPVTRRR
jgi:abequosyltransferase